MAHIFAKSGTHVLCLETREEYFQQMIAPGWTDLRILFYLSLTSASDDDTITGLTENLGTISNDPSKAVWIGVKNGSGVLPFNPAINFIGYTTGAPALPGALGGSSSLTNSTNFWVLSTGGTPSFRFTQGTTFLDGSVGGTNSNPQFVENVGGAGGYATLLGMRLQRSSASSPAITATVPIRANLIYSNTPTKAELLGYLEAFPTNSSSYGPYIMSAVPDTVICYWPFFLSRLRLSSRGFIRIS